MEGNRACTINYAKIRVVGTSNISLSRAIKLAKHFEIDPRFGQKYPSSIILFVLSLEGKNEKRNLPSYLPSFHRITSSFRSLLLSPYLRMEETQDPSNHSSETIVELRTDYIFSSFFQQRVHHSTQVRPQRAPFITLRRLLDDPREEIDQPTLSFSFHRPNPTQFFPQFFPRENKPPRKKKKSKKKEKEGKDRDTTNKYSFSRFDQLFAIFMTAKRLDPRIL